MHFTAWILVAIAINCVASMVIMPDNYGDSHNKKPRMGGPPLHPNDIPSPGDVPIGAINQTHGHQDTSFVVAPGEGGRPPNNWQLPYEPPMPDPYPYDRP